MTDGMRERERDRESLFTVSVIPVTRGGSLDVMQVIGLKEQEELTEPQEERT